MIQIAGAGTAVALLGTSTAKASGDSAAGKMNAVWVHGSAFQAEDLGAVTAIRRFGWGTVFSGKPGVLTWFHISIATPVIINETRPLLERAFVLFKPEGATVRSVHLWDGAVRLRAFDNLSVKADLSNGLFKQNTFEVNPPVSLRFALGISVGVQFSVGFDSKVTTDILFTNAGADFRTT